MAEARAATGQFDEFLQDRNQQEWDDLSSRLAERIHPVDRQATRIWVAFWPLKLSRLLQKSPDQEAVIRDYRLKGKFRLEEQIDSAASFLYGARFWPRIKAELVSQSQDFQAPNLESAVLASAERVAAQLGVDPSLVVGISLVAHLMAAHVGLEALESSARTPATPAGFHKTHPERLCRQREKQSRGGLLGFLETANRQFKVRADPHQKGGFQFHAYQGQDLSMAAKSDTRDYRKLDARRLEGPIPFECRSGSCGFCWVGVLSPLERLEKITPFEIRRLQYFGYMPRDVPPEEHPPIRLACQTPCWGDTQVVIPPWNGTLKGRD